MVSAGNARADMRAPDHVRLHLAADGKSEADGRAWRSGFSAPPARPTASPITVMHWKAQVQAASDGDEARAQVPSARHACRAAD